MMTAGRARVKMLMRKEEDEAEEKALFAAQRGRREHLNRTPV
jgi:hypothetical protein